MIPQLAIENKYNGVDEECEPEGTSGGDFDRVPAQKFVQKRAPQLLLLAILLIMSEGMSANRGTGLGLRI